MFSSNYEQTITFGEIIQIVLAAIALVVPSFWWLWLRFFVYPRTFHLDYPIYPYGDKRDTGADKHKTIGLNRTTIQVRIQVRYSIEINTFNLRFINTNGTDVPTSTVRIVQVVDQVEYTRINFWQLDDQRGGRNCGYHQPNWKGHNEYLRFQVEIDAQRQWDGFLSFMGYDKAGRRAHARAPLSAR